MYVLVTGDSAIYYSITDLRRDNPQVSFPAEMNDSLLAEYSVYPLTATPYPEVDYTKNVANGDPVLVDGNWTQVWIVSDATPEEIEQRLDDQWANIREERNRKLSDCDWTQLPDAPVDAAAWSVYRQELRDITEQPDPFNITWPQEP